MPDRHLVLMPLPHGRSRGNAGRLSVLLVPRLRAGGTLSQWTSDWARWPAVVLGATGRPRLQFNVAINGAVQSANANIGPNNPRWTSTPPDPAVWAAVFGTGVDSIRVEPDPRLDRRQIPWAPGYDAVQLADQIGALFDDLATAFPTDPPTVSQLTRRASYAAAVAAGHAAAVDAHLQPLSSDRPDGAPDLSPDPEDLEFHDAYAVLQAHPRLMRALGLVVDLEVQLPRTVTSVTVTSTYPAIQAGTAGAVSEVRTTVAVDDDFWPRAVRPAPGAPAAAGAWQLLDDGDHAIESIDPSAFVAWLRSWTSADGDHGALPEAGILVARRGESVIDELRDRMERQWNVGQEIASRVFGAGSGPIPIDANDVRIGLRYDVYDESARRWFSLWDREVPDGYVFPRNESLRLQPSPDEGWMTHTAFTEAERHVIEIVDRTPQRVSPVSVAWRGWSLATPPPGKAISGELGVVDVDPDANRPSAASSVQVAIDYVAPAGVLPRLRFGRSYRVRARIVDYAGNSRAVSELPPRDGAVLGPHTFGRTSPLEPPVVIRSAPRPIPGRGDTADVIVIRSDVRAGNPTALVPDGDVGPARRLFLPPRTSVDRCELHGRPAPDGLPTDEATFRMLVQRDAASIESQSEVDERTGELVHPDPADTRPAATYLTDPAATGVSFWGLPGSDAAITSALTGAWPEVSGLALELRAGTRPPVTSTSPTAPAVTCELPKGVTRTVEVSSTAGLLEHWRARQRAAGNTSAEKAVIDAMTSGRHWMVSARDPVTLVHATRLPLTVPTVQGLTIERVAVDDPSVVMGGTYGLDVKSTDRLTATGTWTDPEDRGAGPIGTATTRRVLRSQGWEYAEDAKRPVDTAAFDLGDTKRHTVDVTLEAFSRYARHFAERTSIVFDDDTAVVHAGGLAPGSVEVFLGSDPTVPGPQLRLGDDVVVDEVAGTITRVDGGRVPAGGAVLVDAVHAPFSRMSTETAPADTYRVLVPNSGIPDAAMVDEVLPAFARSTTVTDTSISVAHDAQVIRVWLRRPWHATGDGERLGVVCDRADQGHASGHSRFARDPLTGGTTSGRLTPEAFVARSETLLDADGTGLDVAAHPVAFDAVRDRWFADVRIGAPLGYRPFVQLSVGRFQPVSIPGAHLGPTALTDPLRLGPSRSVTATLGDGAVTVTVSGEEMANQVLVRVQRANPDISDADLRWQDTGVVVELTRQRNRGWWTGSVPLTATDTALRLVVEDAELLQRDGGTVRQVVYVETIELPAAWLPDGGGQDPASPPAQVGGVTVAARRRALDVAWDVPDDGGSAIDGYEVQARVRPQDDGDGADDEGGDWPISVAVRERSTSTRVAQLVDDTTYQVRVRASNATGIGPWSDVVEGTPGR